AFGLGYTALAFIRSELIAWSRVAGTVRESAKAERLRAQGLQAYPLDGNAEDAAIAAEIRAADAILVSVPPEATGDPTLARFGEAIAAAPQTAWIGYLSTTGVYGDRGGAWIDEATPPAPQSPRSRRRLAAEQEWLEFGSESGKAVHVFRLAGIYGPGRNPLVSLARGTARRIVKPGQVFNRI